MGRGVQLPGGLFEPPLGTACERSEADPERQAPNWRGHGLSKKKGRKVLVEFEGVWQLMVVGS